MQDGFKNGMRIKPANIDLPPEILLKLLESASACAAALLLGGADRFTIEAGELSKSGFNQMRLALQRYWPAPTQHDLNRYVGVYLDERFYVLFAKFLPHSNYLLSLVFTPQTPLVRIRQDMTDVMRHVLQIIRSQMPKSDSLEQSLQFVIKPYLEPGLGKSTPSVLGHGRVQHADDDRRKKEEVVPEQTFPKTQDSSRGWRPLPDPANFNPSPSGSPPVSASSGEVWVPLDGMIASRPSTSPELEQVPANRFSKDSLENWQPLEETSQPESDLVRLFHGDSAIKKEPPVLEGEAFPSGRLAGEQPKQKEPIEDEVTRPHIAAEDSEFEQIKLSDITFYLVPHQNEHYLLGELAQRLRDWFPGVCETYGWQLDHLSVRPDYIKWQLHDFPDALIHEMLEIVRARTSERIFRVFPNLRQGNPTKDFWSPGYLVDRQNQDFSTQVLIAHVAQGRAAEKRMQR